MFCEFISTKQVIRDTNSKLLLLIILNSLLWSVKFYNFNIFADG